MVSLVQLMKDDRNGVEMEQSEDGSWKPKERPNIASLLFQNIIRPVKPLSIIEDHIIEDDEYESDDIYSPIGKTNTPYKYLFNKKLPLANIR